MLYLKNNKINFFIIYNRHEIQGEIKVLMKKDTDIFQIPQEILAK